MRVRYYAKLYTDGICRYYACIRLGIGINLFQRLGGMLGGVTALTVPQESKSKCDPYISLQFLHRETRNPDDFEYYYSITCYITTADANA